MRSGLANHIHVRGINALTPRSIPDLAAWWNARAGNYALTGTSVDVAYDLSGNGRHLTAGAATCTLEANGMASGVDAFRFVAASSQRLLCASLGAAFSGTDKPMSVFAVVKHTTGSAAGRTLWSLGRAADSKPLRRWATDATDHLFRQHRNDANVLFNSGTPANSLFSGSAQIVSHVADGTDDSAWLASIFNSTATDTATGLTTLDEFAWGCFLNGASSTQFWDGRLSELLFYERAVTNEERLRIEEYLMLNAGLP